MENTGSTHQTASYRRASRVVWGTLIGVVIVSLAAGIGVWRDGSVKRVLPLLVALPTASLGVLAVQLLGMGLRGDKEGEAEVMLKIYFAGVTFLCSAFIVALEVSLR